MSDQTDPPSWGQQPPPPNAGYGQPYGDQPSYAAARDYASWGQRVGAYLVDMLVMIPAYVVIGIGAVVGFAGAESTVDPATGLTTTEGVNGAGVGIMVLGYLLIFVIAVWNLVFRQGRTGWSVGKQVLGIRLVKEETGEPMGAGLCFVRQVVHIVDSLPCYLGYLWPLWDAKRQTFADKIMTTVVVQQRKA